jgi:DNA-binding NarL/FixJ family response regulator
MAKPVTALVIAKIDPIGDSLLVLLQSLPQVEMVQRARSYPAARQLIKRTHPALVLLDADVRDQKLIEAIQNIRLTWPQARIIVLVENEAQQQAARHAGADVAFIEGIQAKKLLDATELLLQSENNSEVAHLTTLPSRAETDPSFQNPKRRRV